MANLYDVASRAGVSKTLVSRVLNHQKGVSEKSREKILAAMRDLKYVPNALARSLVLQKTCVIGVVLDSLCEPYFFGLINGIQEAIIQSGYDVLFCSAQNDIAAKERNVRFFSEGRADGVIIYGSNLSDRTLIQGMSAATFPFVVVENIVEGLQINNVVVDNISGAKAAVGHLAGLGCRSIWHFTGDMKRMASINRKLGYIQGMQENGLPVTPECIVQSDFDINLGHRQMKELLRTRPDSLPDGIFFGGDITAFGALAALQEEGIAVPDRIKIVGFDNDDPRKFQGHLPGLTTLGQPLYHMGRSAVEILLSAVDRPETPCQNRVFYPELIIRESTVAGKE